MAQFMSGAEMDQALAILRWRDRDLSDASRVPAATISRVRRAGGGGNAKRQKTVARLRRALEQAGVAFLPGGAVVRRDA